jgi:transposase
VTDDRFDDREGTSTRRWRKRGQTTQALGRSRGGFSTKIHAACDSLGNPVRFILTGGQESDYTQALALIRDVKTTALLADKGYDADYIVSAAKDIKAQVVIPPKSNRKQTRDYDVHLYKQRNLVERMFNKLKHFRKVATRYDKTDLSFMSFIQLAAAYLWLK